MKTITEHIRDKLHDRLGISDDTPVNGFIGDLRRSEWCNEFECHMRDRMVMGAIRYGCLGMPGKHQYDRVAEVKKRIQKYETSGNTEFLVDVANMALVEFVEGNHPNKHFKAIDDGEHAKRIGD